MKIREKLHRSALPKDRIKECMLKSGKKQIDIANESGISKGTISKYLSGEVEPKVEAINKLAQVFGVSGLWLSGYDDPEEKQNSPGEQELSEGEKMLLDLFRQIPEESQPLVLQMIKAALGSLK